MHFKPSVLTRLSTTTTSCSSRILKILTLLVRALSRPPLQSTSSRTQERLNCSNSKRIVKHWSPQWPKLTPYTNRLGRLTKTTWPFMILKTLSTYPMLMVFRPLAQGSPMNSFLVTREMRRTPGMSSISPIAIPLSHLPLKTLIKAKFKVIKE